MSVDDATAIEVVGRQLDADAVSGKDADPEPAHLPRDVPEHDMVVVELHAEHRVGQGLDDLALELDLLFLRHVSTLAPAPSDYPGEVPPLFPPPPPWPPPLSLPPPPPPPLDGACV